MYHSAVTDARPRYTAAVARTCSTSKPSFWVLDWFSFVVFRREIAFAFLKKYQEIGRKKRLRLKKTALSY